MRFRMLGKLVNVGFSTHVLNFGYANRNSFVVIGVPFVTIHWWK